MARLSTISRNVAAALDMVAWCEGVTSVHHPLTRNDGYDVIVTGVDGREVFTDYARHPFALGRPAKLINKAKGLYSTASGRYQFIIKTWLGCAGLLALRDFRPESQDEAAVLIFKQRRALNLIEAGMIEDAIKLIAPEWASLPGKGYPGQGQRTLAQCIAIYELKGGFRWISYPSSLVRSDGSPQSLPPPPLSSDSKPKPEVTAENLPKPTPQAPTPPPLWRTITQWLKSKMQR
jgi:muramidase (phage lysozyme)